MPRNGFRLLAVCFSLEIICGLKGARREKLDEEDWGETMEREKRDPSFCECVRERFTFDGP